MTLTVPPEIEKVAAEQARHSGLDTDGLILQALRDYFLPIPSALQKEFDDWELASDEDAVVVDTLLGEAASAAR